MYILYYKVTVFLYVSCLLFQAFFAFYRKNVDFGAFKGRLIYGLLFFSCDFYTFIKCFDNIDTERNKALTPPDQPGIQQSKILHIRMIMLLFGLAGYRQTIVFF